MKIKTTRESNKNYDAGLTLSKNETPEFFQDSGRRRSFRPTPHGNHTSTKTTTPAACNPMMRHGQSGSRS
ncbi:MAG: hypothetical protein AAF663_04820, partial [Planctomycetota bacterium]